MATYDPRGLGRSVRKDGRVDNAPTVQADDDPGTDRDLGVVIEIFSGTPGERPQPDERGP